MVHTPRLCGEPVFLGGDSDRLRNVATVVRCQPVRGDEPPILLPGEALSLGETEPAVGSGSGTGAGTGPAVTVGTSTWEEDENDVRERILNGEDDNEPMEVEGEYQPESETEGFEDVEALTVTVDPESGEVIIEGDLGPELDKEDDTVAAELGANTETNSAGEKEKVAGAKPQFRNFEEMAKLVQKAITAALQEHAAATNNGGKATEMKTVDNGQIVNAFKELQREALAKLRNGGKAQLGTSGQYAGSARHRQLAKLYGSTFGKPEEETEDAQAKERKRDEL